MPSSKTRRRAAKKVSEATDNLDEDKVEVVNSTEVSAVRTEFADMIKLRGFVIEPEGAHAATIIFFHGLGDDARYWEPFLNAIKDSLKGYKSIRFLCLGAPSRQVWGEWMNAWFEYYSDRSGDIGKEDDICELQLVELREALHSLIQVEVDALKEHGGAQKVLLVGSSQGGSVALDVALSWPGSDCLAGVAMLRSLALGATARSSLRLPNRRDTLLKVLAVSGTVDATFDLRLVRQQLQRIIGFTELTHEIVSGLDHDVSYDKTEMAHTVSFINECLSFGEQSLDDVKTLVASLPDDSRPACEKAWADLSEKERTWANQLGIKGANAWDAGAAPVWSKAWNRLTSDQHRAASRLGFTETSWDSDD